MHRVNEKCYILLGELSTGNNLGINQINGVTRRDRTLQEMQNWTKNAKTTIRPLQITVIVHELVFSNFE